MDSNKWEKTFLFLILRRSKTSSCCCMLHTGIFYYNVKYTSSWDELSSLGDRQRCVNAFQNRDVERAVIMVTFEGIDCLTPTLVGIALLKRKWVISWKDDETRHQLLENAETMMSHGKMHSFSLLSEKELFPCSKSLKVLGSNALCQSPINWLRKEQLLCEIYQNAAREG